MGKTRLAVRGQKRGKKNIEGKGKQACVWGKEAGKEREVFGRVTSADKVGRRREDKVDMTRL